MARERWLGLLVALALACSSASVRAEPSFPDTSLPLRLIGTVVSGEAERSIAIIESEGTTHVLRAGEGVGAARVREIKRDEIVLVNAGRVERLALAPVAVTRPEGTALARAHRSSAKDVDEHGVDASGRGSERAAGAARPRSGARTRKRAPAVPASAARGQDDETDAAVRQAVGGDQMLVNLSGQARYKPLLDENGQLRGVAVLDVRPDSTLERLGLRSGDVVVSVAGVRVDNSAAAFNALRALDPSAGGEVLVERGGLPTRITVPPGAL